MTRMLNLLVVEARFYEAISDVLYAGAERALRDASCRHKRVSVPGALEIPAAIACAADSGDFDGYVALGCVIRGETSHYDIVAGESARGLQELAIARRLAIGNGILTVETEAQAMARANPHEGNKGATAVAAALAMIRLKQHFESGE